MEGKRQWCWLVWLVGGDQGRLAGGASRRPGAGGGGSRVAASLLAKREGKGMMALLKALLVPPAKKAWRLSFILYPNPKTLKDEISFRVKT